MPALVKLPATYGGHAVEIAVGSGVILGLMTLMNIARQRGYSPGRQDCGCLESSVQPTAFGAPLSSVLSEFTTAEKDACECQSQSLRDLLHDPIVSLQLLLQSPHCAHVHGSPSAHPFQWLVLFGFVTSVTKDATLSWDAVMHVESTHCLPQLHHSASMCTITHGHTHLVS